MIPKDCYQGGCNAKGEITCPECDYAFCADHYDEHDCVDEVYPSGDDA